MMREYSGELGVFMTIRQSMFGSVGWGKGLRRALVAMALAALAVPATAVPAAAAAPPNNAFANAELLGASGSVVRSNVGATAQPGEPSPIAGAASASIWFKWTAPASGMQQVDLIGSDVDTLLSVYDVPVGNPSLVALNEIASDDDGFYCDVSSVVMFTATAGRTYWFQIDTYDPSDTTANMHLTWGNFRGTPAPNDDIAMAPILSSAPNVPTVATGSTLHATSDMFTEDWPASTLWYRVAAPAGSRVTFDITNDGADTFYGYQPFQMLFVFSGANPATAVYENGGDSASGEFVLNVPTPKTLWLQVESTVCESGAFQLSVDVATGPVTSGYNPSEMALLVQSAAKLNMTPQQLQHDSVGIVEFIYGIAGISGPIVVPPPAGGADQLTSSWPQSDVGVLNSLSTRWSGLTPSDTQKYATGIVMFLLTLT